MDVSNSRPVRKLGTLGSVAGEAERIINDSIEEISDSNEPFSSGERSRDNEDRSRHRRSKRTFKEIDKSVTYHIDSSKARISISRQLR